MLFPNLHTPLELSCGAFKFLVYIPVLLFLCYLFILKNNFIYFWLHWVFIAVFGLSLVAASRGFSSLQCMGFSLQWLPLLRSTGSGCMSFSNCSMWAQQLLLLGSEHRLSGCGTWA